MRKATTTDRCKWLKNKIKECDKELHQSHYNRRKEDELKAIERMKYDKDYFFTYVKKKLKTNTKIGPFVNDKGIVIDKPIPAQLNDQYADMWSNPLKDKTIDLSNYFDMDENSDKPTLSQVIFTR